MGRSPSPELGKSPCPRTQDVFKSDVGRSPRSDVATFTNSRLGRWLGRERSTWTNVGVGCCGSSSSGRDERRSRMHEASKNIESSFTSYFVDARREALCRRGSRGKYCTVVTHFYIHDRCILFCNHLRAQVRYWENSTSKEQHRTLTQHHYPTQRGSGARLT